MNREDLARWDALQEIVSRRLGIDKGGTIPIAIAADVIDYIDAAKGSIVRKDEIKTALSFVNESGLQFTPIDCEALRFYEWPTHTVRIEKPLWLHVSESGGHRIFDAAGCCHYIPPGWSHLYWFAREGRPHFVK